MKRNLSGIYFREKIDSKWENVCFEDLSKKSQDRVLKDRNEKWLKSLAKMLGKTIKEIGDKFDIVKD